MISEVETDSLRWEPLNKATKRGYQTPSTVFDWETGAIQKLKDILLQELHGYQNRFDDRNCDLIKLWPKKYDLSGWFVRLKTHGYQEAHIHPDGWVSGVLYLKTIEETFENQGSIEFSLHGYDYHRRSSNVPTKTHQPKLGDILLFPSSLFHRTIPFDSPQDRCVIAFDVVPREK